MPQYSTGEPGADGFVGMDPTQKDKQSFIQNDYLNQNDRSGSNNRLLKMGVYLQGIERQINGD